MFGAFDGVYLRVSMHDAPDFLAQGWEIVFVVGQYGVMMKAPGDF